MDKVNQKMKKISNLLGGFRSSMANQPKTDFAIEEILKSENFQISKTSRHGFPFKPTAIAFDPIQNLLAIGNQSGEIKILGRPGVEYELKHDSLCSIIQIVFLINEGALISLTTDDQIHMWTLRQKKPEIVHSLKFQRESLTVSHLPFQSKWLYIGTERGNVQILNLETFSLSGYVISWNKAMDLMRSTHPGAVVHLSDNPNEPNKLLIGFETGVVVLWDLKLKAADCRYACTESLRSISWYQDGKQFVCSHGDGSITTWMVRETQKPRNFMMPHAKLKDNKPETCRPINKVDYRSNRNSEAFIVFSGGMPTANSTPSLTVMKGNNMTVLEMEHPIIDFQVLCSTPYNNDYQDPIAIAVLLSNDLVIVDLTTQGYPCYENPYAMDIHESPVTSCVYFADCPPDLIPAYYSVGCQRKRSGYSEKEWPIHGGEESPANCSYPELILTGHADGCLKIWDASSVTLQVLYKLKTGKVFDITRCIIEDDTPPFAIHHIYLCVDSRILCLAGTTHVLLFRFSKQEVSCETPVLEVCINYEINDSLDFNDCDFQVSQNPDLKRQSDSVSSFGATNFNGKDANTSVRVKAGPRKWPHGYQPDLCCLLLWIDDESPPPITSISLNSKFGLLAFGDECGIAIIDIVQKTCLLSMGTPDLYGSMDPYSRAPRSPKCRNFSRPAQDLLSQGNYSDDCRSPTVEQSQDQIDLSSDTDILPHQDHHAKRMLQPVHSRDEVCTLPDPKSNPTLSNSSQDTLVGDHTPSSKDLPLNTEPKRSLLSKSKSNPISKEPKLPVKSGNNSTLSRFTIQFKTLFDSVAISKNRSHSQPNGKNSNELNQFINNKRLGKKFSDIEEPDVVDLGLKNKVTAKMMVDSQKNIGPLAELSNKPDNMDNENLLDYNDGLSSQISKNPVKSEPEPFSHDPSDNPFLSNHEGKAEISDILIETSIDPIVKNDQPDFKELSDPNRSSEHNNKDKVSSAYGEKVSHWKDVVKFKRSFSEAVEPTNSQSFNSNPQIKDYYKSASRGVDITDGFAMGESKKSLIKSDDQLNMTNIAPYKTKLLHLKSCNLKRPDSITGKTQDPISFRSAANRVKNLDYKIVAAEKGAPIFYILDYSADDAIEPCIHSLTYSAFIKLDKAADSGAFSRSHSSSTTSLENVNKESIECLVFTEAYTRKSDTATCPCLWVGTNLGTVLVISLSLPIDSDSRRRQPVIISPSGTIYRLKGSILSMSFLDCNGYLVTQFTETWKDMNKEKDEKKTISKLSSSPKNRISPSASLEIPVIDRQFVIICSEKQARVISLPSQTCVYKVKVTETSSVIKAEVIPFKDGVCLCCYVANGHIVVFSLPSLKPLLDSDYIYAPNIRIERTLCFSNYGHILYMCSPTKKKKVPTATLR